MTRFALLVLLCVISLGAASAPTPGQPAAPASVTAEVDRIFEKWNRPNSPGCALSVIQNDRILYKHGYGMADLDHDVPITPATVFHVASVSKQFTAAAVALLSQQGKLSLDDDVRKYIPEVPDLGARITIRHLIHHTSGLRDQWESLELAGWRYSLDLITDDDVLEMVSRQKALNFRPGEKYMYCNTGYTLLAMIVKRISGQSFREFTHTHFFQPLGMKNTHFRDDHAEIVKNQAYGYNAAKGDTFRLSITNFDTVGATSLLTTVEDLALWDQNFYDKRIGGSKLIEQLHGRGRLNNGEQLDYAFGLILGKYRGLPIIEHSGGDAGYRAHLIRFPEQRFSVACLCNAGSASPGQFTRQVADIYLSKEFKEPPPIVHAEAESKPSPDQLASKVALYWDRDSDRFRRIVVKENKLYAVFSDESLEMLPLSENRFRTVSFPVEVRFEATPDGSWRMIQVFPAPEGKPVSYERVAPISVSRTELAEYVGTYTSEEMEAVYRMALDSDALVLKRLRHNPEKLEPAQPGVFLASIGTMRFERDGTNRVFGFVLNGGRVRNFRFTKKQD